MNEENFNYFFYQQLQLHNLNIEGLEKVGSWCYECLDMSWCLEMSWLNLD